MLAFLKYTKPPVIASLCILLLTLGACRNKDKDPVPLGLFETVEFSDYRKVEVGWQSNDGITLSGSLFLPKADDQQYPTVMWHWGSDPWSRVENLDFIKRWLNAGLAVFTYDKRGVGKSQGFCCPWQGDGYFQLLGQDLLSGVRTIAAHPNVDDTKVGLYGFSQGGLAVPPAAAESNGDIAFVVIGSGSTVTLGEELNYSILTGENQCIASGRSESEIDAILEEEGPSGFNPAPYLEQMDMPGLWIYGAEDLSVPVKQSVAILDELIDQNQKPFEYEIISGANHSWLRNARICQQVGADFVDKYPDIFEWILSKVN